MTEPTHAFSVAQCGCVILNNWKRSKVRDNTYITATVISRCDGGIDDRMIHPHNRAVACNLHDPRPITDEELQKLLDELSELCALGYDAMDMRSAMRNILRDS